MIDIPLLPPEQIETERRERRERAAVERRPIVIGLICTVVVHLLLGLLFWNAPHFPDYSTLSAADEELRRMAQKELMFNLVPDEEELAERAHQPSKYVETNPDAPENDPGKTDNYGSRNQQAAQLVPGKDHSEMPKTTGEAESSTAVVTGSKAVPVELPPPGGGGVASPSPANQPAMQAMVNGPKSHVQENIPLPGYEKITGDNPDGLGTNLGDTSRDATDTDKKILGEKLDKPQPEVAVNGGGQPSGLNGTPGRPGPRPRPKLQQVRPAVLANQPLSASNAGAIAPNSRLSAAGVWWDEFIETVDAQWQRIVDSMTAPPSNTRVLVRFMVNAKGEIARIVEVQGEETTGKIGTLACLDAIQNPAPYKPWTPEMVAMFGSEEEVTFIFYYR